MALQAGTYQAKVVGHQLITSAKKGTPGLDVKVRFSDGWEEQTMTGTIWFSEKAPEKSREQLEAIGFRPAEHRLPDLGVGRSLSLVGNDCEIEVGEEEYNGKKRMKIKWFGTSAPKPPDDETLARFDELMGSTAPPHDESLSGNLPPPPPTPAPTEETLPF